MENNTQEVQEINVTATVLVFIFKKIVNLGFLGVRIVAYFLDLTILMLSNILEKLFLDNWNWYIDRYDEKEEMYEIEVVSNGTKHEYIMNRGKEYDKLYKDLKGNVDVASRGNSIILDLDLSRDIIAKLDRIVYLVERNAIKEGYKFGRASKNKLEDEETYPEFIKYQVRQGK